MDRKRNKNQAYSQKPWRRQLQRIGLFLAAMVFLGLIAGINLRINAEAATTGRQIQKARITVKELENEITDQQALLAELTSASAMERRALELGFHRAASDEITYLVVDGYEGRSPVRLASDGRRFVQTSVTQLPPEFTQTLFDLFLEKFSAAQSIIGNRKP
jgi:hypothetical protein